MRSHATRRPADRRGLALMDALIAGVMLGVAMTVIMSVTSRSLAAQIAGEKRLTASWLADELLTMVLVEGPELYPRQNDISGKFLPPFQEYEFDVEIENLGRGAPYRVNAIVRWTDRARDFVRVETLIAARIDHEEKTVAPDDEVREPYETLDRQARYDERDQS